jgi:hypothetical protein
MSPHKPDPRVAKSDMFVPYFLTSRDTKAKKAGIRPSE